MTSLCYEIPRQGKLLPRPAGLYRLKIYVLNLAVLSYQPQLLLYLSVRILVNGETSQVRMNTKLENVDKERGREALGKQYDFFPYL